MNARTTNRPRRLRSASERAEELGVVVKTVIREIERGALPAHKIGRQWRISDEDFDEYLRRRRRG